MKSKQDHIDDLNNAMRACMDILRTLKHDNPGLRLAVNRASVGSILNGYREGDISFDEAVEMLSVKQSANTEKVATQLWDTPLPPTLSDRYG